MRTRAFLNEVQSCFSTVCLTFSYIALISFQILVCFSSKKGVFYLEGIESKIMVSGIIIFHLYQHIMCVHLMYTCAVLSENNNHQQVTRYSVKQSAYMIQNIQMKISFVSCRGAYSYHIALYVVAY